MMMSREALSIATNLDDALDVKQGSHGEQSDVLNEHSLNKHGSLADDFDGAPIPTNNWKQVATIKTRQLLREEFAGLHLRLLLARLLLGLLPIHVGGRMRTLILRLAGFRIGHGTVMAGTPIITGDGNLYGNLVIGEGCWINIGCLFDLGAAISIGSKVSIGHDVLLLTTSHEVGTSRKRALAPIARPVSIGSGVWLGSRSTILPGVTIGAGAIVAAGSMVHQDVPPNTVVAGVPARVVKDLL
jgi:maltose O-acetyltransferase